MNYNEILEVLKGKLDSADDFAYHFEDYSPEQFTEDQEAAQKSRDAFYESVKDLPRDSEQFKQFLAMPNKYEMARQDYIKSFGLGPIKEVDQYGGEGKGDTWYSVKHFPEHDVYIRVEGFYSSYNGTDFYNGWDSCSEVKPIQKTITVYES